MPDVFIPIDTLGVSEYYMDVRNQGLIYRYSLKYADENRKVLAAFTTPEEFVKYLGKQQVLNKFIIYASREGVKEIPRDIRTSEKILKTQLNAYIARNFIDNEGFFPIIQDIDNTLLKAITLFPESGTK